MPDIAAITAEIDRNLADIARGVITSHLDLADPANQDFLARPDDRSQHQTHWHQWGILTHTRKFLEDYRSVVPCYLREWGLWSAVEQELGEPIDGAAKRDLIEITILLHDLGKFGARTHGRRSFHFAGHEVLSGELIRDELHLESYGLTPAQIEYIALTAADHFVLGLVRKRAREQGEYDERFLSSDQFVAICTGIKATHPLDYVEIGVLFLGDSLAKLNPEEGPDQALSQYDINLETARRYLQLVLS